MYAVQTRVDGEKGQSQNTRSCEMPYMLGNYFDYGVPFSRAKASSMQVHFLRVTPKVGVLVVQKHEDTKRCWTLFQ